MMMIFRIWYTHYIYISFTVVFFQRSLGDFLPRRLFFDDNFLTSQKEPNRAARALLGGQLLVGLSRGQRTRIGPVQQWFWTWWLSPPQKMGVFPCLGCLGQLVYGSVTVSPIKLGRLLKKLLIVRMTSSPVLLKIWDRTSRVDRQQRPCAQFICPWFAAGPCQMPPKQNVMKIPLLCYRPTLRTDSWLCVRWVMVYDQKSTSTIGSTGFLYIYIYTYIYIIYCVFFVEVP